MTIRAVRLAGALLIAAAGSAAAQTAAPPAASPAAATSRLERIQTTRQLKVCIWPAYYAISFRNPRNNELAGIDIDLSAELAKDLGATLTRVDTDFSRFMDDLDNNLCDVAMFSVGILPHRAARVDFTQPYLRSGIYAIATQTNPIKSWDQIDQHGVVVAVQAGTLMEPVMRDYLKKAEMMVVKSPQTREDEVQSGRADVFMTDYPYAQRMRFQHDWARVIAPAQPIGVTNYAYAVAKGDPKWLARMERFVADVKRDGRLAAAARAHGLEPIIVLD